MMEGKNRTCNEDMRDFNGQRNNSNCKNHHEPGSVFYVERLYHQSLQSLTRSIRGFFKKIFFLQRINCVNWLIEKSYFLKF